MRTTVLSERLYPLSTTESTTENQSNPTVEATPPHTPDHAHGDPHYHPAPALPAMNEECRREVSIEIPADVVASLTDKTLRKFQKMARIPGFRAGKVPVTMIKSRFMDDVRSEVVESLVPQHFRAEVEKSGLFPISQPQITDLHFHEGEPLRFKAVFEVMPPFEVKGYKELTAAKQDITVSDEQVDEALKSLQQRQASYEPVEDRELRDGDFANVSFSGTAKGTKKIAEKKAELEIGKEASAAQPVIDQAVEDEINKPVDVNDVMVEIGGANTVKDFSENLRGAKSGEEREFDVTYPDDFSDQRLAGQVMAYKVKVQGVKKKLVPELNDDFAKELGEFVTLDDLKKRVRLNLEAERKHEIEHTEKEKLIDQLVEKNEFPVPQALVDRQVEIWLERGFRALAQQGMQMEELKKMNFERLREAQTPAAVREVRASLLLDKIAELENIEVSQADMDREIEMAALQLHQPLETVRERLEKDGSLDRIKDRLRNEKALDFLYQQSA